MNPYTARWNFIGTEKAKDKVGHALRKAVMNAQGESCDDSSSKQDDERSQANDKTNLRRTTSQVLKEQSAGCPSSPHGGDETLKKRHVTLPKKRKGSVAAPISILKKVATTRYGGDPSQEVGLSVETHPASVSVNESDLASLSRIFSSPAAPTMLRQSSPNDNHGYCLGLSPVARDMFDEKNDLNAESLSRRRLRAKKVSDDDTLVQSNLDPDTENRPLHSRHNIDGSSYTEHRAVPTHHLVPPSTFPPGMPPPPLNTMYAATVHHPHQSSSTPFYYHVPPVHHNVASQSMHPMLPPVPFPPQQPHLSSQSHGGIVLSPRQGTTTPVAREVVQQHQHYSHPGPPSGLLIPPPPVGHPGTGPSVIPPPPPGMYYPPGYYYYPGFMLPPPDASAPGGHNHHHHHVVPQTTLPSTYHNTEVMVESSYYSQHHYEDDDEAERSHGSTNHDTPSP